MIEQTPHNVTNAFCSGDETIINWKGSNYYKACDELVTGNPNGAASYCVKREGHPGDIHEDYDGVRKVEQHGRMTVVVTFPLADNNEIGFKKSQEVLGEMKKVFADQDDVQVYGAIRESADQIIMILNGDG